MNCTTLEDEAFGPRVVSCRDGFDFTLLFEQTIFSAVLSAVSIPVFLAFIIRRLRQSIKTRPNSGRIHGALKQIISLSLIAIHLTLIVLWAFPRSNPTRVSVAASALSMAAETSLMVLIYYDHKRSVRPSTPTSIYLSLSIICDLVQSRTLWLRSGNRMVAIILTAGLGLKVILLSAETVGKRRILSFPYSHYPPEALGGLLNRSVFWWINSLLIKGSSKTLRLDDLFELDSNLKSDEIAPRFRSAWASSTKKRSYSLLLSFLRNLKSDIVYIVAFRICLTAFKFCQPLLINRAVTLLLQDQQDDSNNRMSKLLIGATSIIYLGIGLSTAAFQHKTYRLITKVRGGVITMVHDATLGLDTSKTSSSAALTLMSSDIDGITQGIGISDCLWIGPIEVALGGYLLHRQIGLSFIATIILSLMFVAASIAMRRVSTSAQKAWLDATQNRVAAVSASLATTKAVKMTGLSERIYRQLQSQRVVEMDKSGSFRTVLSLSVTLAANSPVIIPIATLITYALVMRAEGSMNLSPAVAFTTLSLVSLVAVPIQEIAMSVPRVAAALGCFQRVQTYIQADHQQYATSNGTIVQSQSIHSEIELGDMPSAQDTQNSGPLIASYNGSFALKCNETIVLQGISFSILPKTITVLTGPIGSGKSMLLLAMLNELDTINGSLYRHPSIEIGYCAQDPWLPNDTIRQIILSNTEFDQNWYSTIITATALGPDLDNLPAGDLSRVGSNGISLSGGQRKRIALARALYSRKSLLLLDDVLSGLDAATDKSIMDKVFGRDGLLRRHNITCIFSTHSARHIRNADCFIEMEKGGIRKQGYADDIIQDVNFSHEYPLSPVAEPESVHLQSTSQHNGPQSENEAEEELKRPTGDIRLYAYYFQSWGWLNTTGMGISIAAFCFFFKFSTVWVQWWADSETLHPGQKTNLYAGIYGLFCAICVLTFLITMFIPFHLGCPRSSISLHSRLLKTVTQAPYFFFVETDSGHILNRFSQDMTLLCLSLPWALLDSMYHLAVCVIGTALIISASKWSAAILPVIMIVLYLVPKFYLQTSRQMRLLDLEAKTPLYSHFSQTLRGVVTIRAFGWQEATARLNIQLLDRSQRPYYLMFSIQRWLNLTLDIMVAAIATIIIALALSLRDSSAGALGVSLVTILTFSQDLTALVRNWTNLETSLGAVARIRSFERNTPNENLPGETEIPPADWPSKGELHVSELSSTYRPGSSLILKGINLQIKPGTKVGICGRTGSGKSTFLLSLLRMAEIEKGQIFIDGISIQNVPRDTLRQRLNTMPQDPFSLPGTVRSNIDPFSNHDDGSILNALKDVGIQEHILFHGGIDADMSKIPFSQGQHQLFCLTRSILTKSKFVLLDEIASSVDAATERKMMQIVGEKFADRTVLAVAHHLESIRHFDQIVVLDQGKVVETGPPDELLRLDGVFRELWDKQK